MRSRRARSHHPEPTEAESLKAPTAHAFAASGSTCFQFVVIVIEDHLPAEQKPSNQMRDFDRAREQMLLIPDVCNAGVSGT